MTTPDDREHRRSTHRPTPASGPADTSGPAPVSGPESAPGPESGAGPGPDRQTEEEAPDELSDLRPRSWKAILKRTGKEFLDDGLPDRAAALTYYSVLSIFPALLVLVSLLGVAGEKATKTILDNLQKLAPGSAQDILRTGVEDLQNSSGAGGLLAVVGLLGALWSASGYVAGFIRAANEVYDIPEGRPVWKVLPVRLGVTLLMMVLLSVSAAIVVFTGGIAERVGGMIGLGDAALAVWSVAKWPVLVLLVVLMIAVLYWAAPNARNDAGFRWLSPGGFLAVVLWVIASAGFALYVGNFSSYNKTYGSIAGVIIFLIWLWLSNLAILLGLEFDAEMARERAIVGGLPEDEEPYVKPRDTRKWPASLKRRRRARLQKEEAAQR
ncbi:YihY/virulence factor BrkB family protein [Streptomyces thermolineatus]|uniref:YihY/virulence factor BrkB family protein n=1 Tax=Streptomyces thermolineatus TaxID=44033 RepID=A0ABN3L565_9ACTN